MERQPDHWLYRFTPDEWLRAADNELVRARRAAGLGEPRKGLFEARRAAGMALNAMLCRTPREEYGRSYMEHLAALARDAGAPEEIRAAAGRLVARPSLVQLRGAEKEAASAVESAEAIAAWVKESEAPGAPAVH